MPVRTKSIYAEPSRDDGERVLATSYWPRGVTRERAGTYIHALAPSRDLVRAFKDGNVPWTEFRRRYLAEMRGERQRLEIAHLAGLARAKTVTVMCMCPDDRHCHRRLLGGLIEKEAARSG